MKILIIEDNKELNFFMKKGLLSMGFTVDSAYTGNEGEEKAYANSYDVILLDLNLPDKDGLDILEFLRLEEIKVPIIIVSARSDVDKRVSGLNLGADDYLTKPFKLVELHARIQAVIRRYNGRANSLIQINELKMNSLTRVATWQEQVIPLSVKEFEILEYIASKYPAVVSSEDITEHIYDEYQNPFSSALRVHITRLRKKLMKTAGKEVLFTLRGKGYYLCEK